MIYLHNFTLTKANKTYLYGISPIFIGNHVCEIYNFNWMKALLKNSILYKVYPLLWQFTKWC